MPINLLELDAMLEDGVGKHYNSLSKDIKDYAEEYKRILDVRKNEFKQTSFYERIIWNEKSYPYINELVAKQNYHIDSGKIGIHTEEFPLPVTDSTEIEKVEIYSPARIPCGCWDGIRKKIAEENGLMIGDNKFYASVAYMHNIPSRKKSVKFASSLIDIIIDVKNAKERLEAGIQKDFNNKLELTKI